MKNFTEQMGQVQAVGSDDKPQLVGVCVGKKQTIQSTFVFMGIGTTKSHKIPNPIKVAV